MHNVCVELLGMHAHGGIVLYMCACLTRVCVCLCVCGLIILFFGFSPGEPQDSIEYWFGSVKTSWRGHQGSCTIGNSIAAAQMLHLKQSKSMGKVSRDQGNLFPSASGPLHDPRSGQNYILIKGWLSPYIVHI